MTVASEECRTIPKLKMLSAGNYLYDRQYMIRKTSIRSINRRIWTVFKSNGSFYLNADTLTNAIRRLECVLMYEKETKSCVPQPE